MARRQTRWLSRCMTSVGVIASALCAAGSPTQAVTFTDAAQNPATGIGYRRAPSVTKAIFDTVKALPFLSRLELNRVPDKSEGAPGVALIDFDMDGDDDIYATNGPGRDNSLYKNMWQETGALTFTDVGAAAGVGAFAQDSTGVCYGDVDNDGDPDLLVLGRMEPSRFFRNEGDGTFTDISSSAGVALEARGHTSCAMGDVDGDGLLDIFIANTYDWVNRASIYTQSFAFNHANQLYLNRGGNLFDEVTGLAGLMELFNVPAGNGTISWATAMVDIDLDGDLDIIHGDDQAAMPSAGFAGVDRGFQQLFLNDGTGIFTNATLAAGLNQVGAWMGLSFGDVNYDGRMDIFGSNAGDYIVPQFGFPVPPGLYSSRWFVQDAPGHFSSPTLATFGPTVFGWGTGMTDYDNDGDTDIIFYGNINAVGFATADNPGIILNNQNCSASFFWDQAATAATAEFVARQTVEGVALGDLNDDGFTDIVYAAGMYSPPTLPLVRMNNQYGSVFDATAFMVPTFYHIGPFEWEWAGRNVEEGFLGVQISSASNGNRWVKISVKGAKGITPRGKVNRDGIGALLKFTPSGGKQSLMPVLGGSSYQSQHALTQGFGLGTATKGTLDILWPGKVKNRLYDVSAGERVTFPEIPCDFAATWPNRRAYRTCVNEALDDLVDAHVINNATRGRLYASAIRAYNESH